MKRRGKPPKQQTLESTLGQAPMIRVQRGRQGKAPIHQDSSPKPIGNFQTRLTGGSQAPSPKFMPKAGRRGPLIQEDSSDSSAEENDVIPDEEGDDELQQLARQPSQSKQGQTDDTPLSTKNNKMNRRLPQSKGVDALPIIIDEDDSDDMPLATPSSSFPRRRRARAIALDHEDEDESEQEVISAAKRRRITRKQPGSPVSSDSEPLRVGTLRKSGKKSIATKASTPKKGEGNNGQSLDTPVKRSSRSARKGPRTEKQKQMELLRRRRMGEKVDEEDLTSSSDEGHKALYDTDSDHLALDEFEDDDEGLPSSPLQRGKKGNKAKTNESAGKKKPMEKIKANENLDSDDSLDDFVVEDDEGPIGVPADLLQQEIPLEFTAHAHKPLKAHFKDAIEWLVQRRINPTFNKDDALYRLAWRKLDDEVRGLAQSKFMSAGWKTEFHKALRARPYLESRELEKNDPARLQTCFACGRSNHPATWKIKFDGAAYHKDTLDDVESESDEGETSDDEDDNKSVDEDGNSIEPTTKEWFVGVVCNSNAETAHNLMHWKRALMDWVEQRLQEEGWLEAEELQKRDRMKPKKRRELANEIVDNWEATGILKALFGDFKENLEQARNKSTTARGRARG